MLVGPMLTGCVAHARPASWGVVVGAMGDEATPERGAMSVWKIEVKGIVSRWVEGGRYPVTEAEWKMEKLDGDKFRFSRFGEDTFELSGKEVRTYIFAKTLMVIEGDWP